MLSYTTLGNGASTKVLAVVTYGDARTVTTCPHKAAVVIAPAIEACYRQMPAALYPVAVELDGTPVQARRQLLNVLDTAVFGTPALAGGTWETAESLIVTLAGALAGQAKPVIAAARAELAEHLDGFDGVLVPCVIGAGGYRRAETGFVAPLDALDWPYAVGLHGDLSTYADGADTFVVSNELHVIPHALYDAEPTDLSGFSVQELFDAVDDDGAPDVKIAPRHMVAWVAANRPHDLAAVTAALTTR